MRILDLDDLLGDDRPEASFHDALLESVVLDHVSHTARLGFSIPVEVVDDHYMYNRGTLELGGLLAFACETQRTLFGRKGEGGLSIDAGPLPEPRAVMTIDLPADLPEDAFCYWIFSNDTNSFLLFAATHARFAWAESS